MTAFGLIEITSDNFSVHRHRIMSIEKDSFLSPWPLCYFTGELQNPLSRLWAVSDNEGIAGFACFWTVAGEMHLLNIAVEARKRGKGAGTFLLGKIIEEGRNTGAERIWLEVRPSNSAALNIYLRAGFTVEGRRARYYSDTGEDALVMSLSPFSPAVMVGVRQRAAVASGFRKALPARPAGPAGQRAASWGAGL